MKRLIITLVSVLTLSSLYAEEMRLSDSIFCYYLGSLYYGESVGYQLNFETQSLTLLDRKGEGKLVTITIVVPRKGNKNDVLPEGEFLLGACDTVRENSLDFYRSSVRYYGVVSDSYDNPDFYATFLHCNVSITKLKRKTYKISIDYELNNGDNGTFTYEGKIRTDKHDQCARFKYQPEEKRVKNWELTEAKLQIVGGTAYSSREATLTFACADEIYGMVVVYLPTDSVTGRYVIRHGREAGSCESSSGGYDANGFYNLFNAGIEEDSTGFIYYPKSGFVDITKDKMFFEFTTIDGSVVRGVYNGEITVEQEKR